MPKLRSILSAFSLIIFAVVVAHAQGSIVMSVQAGQGSGSGTGNGSGTGIGAVTGVIGGFSSTSMSGTPGQPFSADVIDETDRLLADGNHIRYENHGRIFRDSQGRTRNETEMGNLSPGAKPFLHVMISDPVEGRFILLNPQQKVATIHQFVKRTSAGTGLNDPVGNAAKPAAPITTTATVRRPMPATGSLRNMKTPLEDLGTMEIEGYMVTGTRYTHTIPAGEMGNDQPMTATSERWFSQDLKMDLLNKSESPDAGKHVHKLVNIRVGDPDPLLFQVPADYTVKEGPQQQ